MFIHTTRDGDEVPISGMTDSHLVNTIITFTHKAREQTTEMSCAPQVRSPRAKALYGERGGITPSGYRSTMKRVYEQAGPYVMEAVVRGIDVRSIVCEAVGRSALDEEAPRLKTSHGRIVDGVILVGPPGNLAGIGLGRKAQRGLGE